jgi:hypothetical protein
MLDLAKPDYGDREARSKLTVGTIIKIGAEK